MSAYVSARVSARVSAHVSAQASEPFVVAHLFQPTHPMSLRHIGGPRSDTQHSDVPRLGHIATADGGAPAVLVIPRGGPIRAPHLMVLRGSQEDLPVPLYDLVAGDPHIVADVDHIRDRPVRALADVLLTRRVRQPLTAAARVTETLERFMGCAVVVTPNRDGCLMGFRDGRVAEITGAGGFGADRRPWPEVLGSFLYSWLVARIPLGTLSSALVIAGHYLGVRNGGCELRVAGRVTIGVRPNAWTGQARIRVAS